MTTRKLYHQLVAYERRSTSIEHESARGKLVYELDKRSRPVRICVFRFIDCIRQTNKFFTSSNKMRKILQR